MKPSFCKSQSLLLRRRCPCFPSSPVFNTKRKYCSIRKATLDSFEKSQSAVDVSFPATKLQKNQAFNPVVDSEIPQVVSMVSDAHMSRKEFAEVELPELPPVTDPSFEFLLGVKLEMMSQVLDFTDSNLQIMTKHKKTEMLTELQTFLMDRENVSRLNSKYQRAIFIMIEKNVLHECPTFPDRMRTLDYQVPVVNPAWPHIQLCHRLLLTFIQLFPNAEFVNMAVVRRVIWLIQLPDANERECLMRFVAKFYELRPESRNQIVNMLQYSLIEVQEGLSLPYCAAGICDLLTFIVTHDSSQLVHVKRIIKESGVPLLGNHYFQMFSTSLCALVRKVITADPSFASVILGKLEEHWPQVSGKNQAAAVYFLMDIIVDLHSAQLVNLGNRIYTFLGELTGGPSMKVVEACLNIWIKPEYAKWVKTPRVSRELIQAMLPPLLKLKHSNYLRKTALDKLQQAEEAMMLANREMFSIVQRSHGITSTAKHTADPRRRLLELEDCAGTWLEIGQRACMNGANIDLKAWSHETVAFLKQTAREPQVTIKFTQSAEDSDFDFEFD